LLPFEAEFRILVPLEFLAADIFHLSSSLVGTLSEPREGGARLVVFVVRDEPGWTLGKTERHETGDQGNGGREQGHEAPGQRRPQRVDQQHPQRHQHRPRRRQNAPQLWTAHLRHVHVTHRTQTCRNRKFILPYIFF